MVRSEENKREGAGSGFVDSYWRRSQDDVEITLAFMVNDSVQMALLRTMVLELMEENERLRETIVSQAEDFKERFIREEG